VRSPDNTGEHVNAADELLYFAGNLVILIIALIPFWVPAFYELAG
jgi:hypothetical protein